MNRLAAFIARVGESPTFVAFMAHARSVEPIPQPIPAQRAPTFIDDQLLPITPRADQSPLFVGRRAAIPPGHSHVHT